MIWKTEKPTTAGWYWFKGRIESAAVNKTLRTQPYELKTSEVWKEGLALYETDHVVFGLHELKGEWAGPLEIPQSTLKKHS